VVISGEGAHFCAGLDLSELVERDIHSAVLHSRAWHACFDAIQFGRVPVVAALHGAVVGGGLELAAPATSAWPTRPPTTACPKASAASSSAAAARPASRA
jgi:enoyl-CoA hydratase/carnithine racemase